MILIVRLPVLVQKERRENSSFSYTKKRKGKELILLKRNIQEQAFQETLMKLITVRNMPHDFVEWPGFRALCAAVNPESLAILPTASEVLARIDQAKDETEGRRGADAAVTGVKSDGTEAMLRSLDGLDLRDDDKDADSEGTTDSCADVPEDASAHSVGDRSA
ncbi:MAG: hypothetical protein M1821_000771 [Bathelium mastoideum]|nr:MAG: hypothetical protein M1821_000771 [Bathelium mastoideum]